MTTNQPGVDAGRAVRTFPSDDADFAAFVQAWANAPAIRDEADLQRALRVRYPAAVVRAQSDLGRLAGDEKVWYVFRYGRADAADEPAVPVDGDAWAVVDDRRRFVAVTEAFARIVEATVEAMVGRSLEDFANPDDPTIAADLGAMWAEFRRAGRLASTIRFNYGDGRPREIAFAIDADAEGPGRHRLRITVLPSGGTA